MRVNRKSASADRKSVNPPAILRTEDRQFFHHELRLADGANHVGPRRDIPLPRHTFAGVAAPAFDVSATRERTAIDLFQIVFVQPGFARAIDVIAVIEHEAGPV